MSSPSFEKEANQLLEIGQFFIIKQKLFGFIMLAMKGDINIVSLYKIIKNEVIAGFVFAEDIKCERFYRLGDALSKMNKSSIILFIAELDIYMRFDNVKDCAILLQRIYDWIIPGDINLKAGWYEGADFSPYQIVWSNQMQRIVFVIRGSDEDIESIRKYCESLFQSATVITPSNTDIDNKHVSVCMDFENLDEVNNCVSKLTNHIREVDQKLSFRVGIHKLISENCGDMEYTLQYVRGDDKLIKYDYDCVKPINNSNIIINNISNVTHITGNTIVAESNVNINNGIVNVSITKTDGMTPEEFAKEWIDNADLKDEINGKASRDVFNKYKDECPNYDPILEGDFGKLVRERGYTKKRKHNINTWISDKLKMKK
jgi:hypothetical protein